MYQLQNIGIRSKGQIFAEQKASEIGLDKTLESFVEQGFVLSARHINKNILLLKNDSEYIILNGEDSESENSVGVIVEDIEDAMKKLWQQPNIDVFDGGVVGELALRLPAFRSTNNQIVYLINEKTADNFFASDFEILTN